MVMFKLQNNDLLFESRAFRWDIPAHPSPPSPPPPPTKSAPCTTTSSTRTKSEIDDNVFELFQSVLLGNREFCVDTKFIVQGVH